MKKIVIAISILLQATTASVYAIELSEVSFKDSTADWIEISISTSDLDPIIVKDDSLITRIEPNEIANKKFILIHFKAETEKIENEGKILHIYTTKSGLTGTTEQLTLETENGDILDSACWKTSSPPDSEIKDMEKLGAFANNCLNSEEINKNTSIAKISNQWQVLSHPTPGEINQLKNQPPIAKIEIQSGELKKTVPFSLNLDGSNSSDPENDPLTYKWSYPNNTQIEKANPPSHRFEKSGTYIITLTVTDTLGASNSSKITIDALPKSTSTATIKNQPNGDLSSSIIITELFPNPLGKDSGKEWIELYNASNSDINLNNWKINDKPLKSLTIKANSFIIYNTTLKNSENTIVLSDFQGKIIDQVTYENSKEGQSFTKVMILNAESQKTSWQWASPTKKTKNPTYKVINGKIIQPPTIGDEFFFKIKDSDETIKTITFSLEEFEFDFLSTLLQEETELSILVDNNSQTPVLKDYHIKNSPPLIQQDQQKTKTHWPYYLSLIVVICTGVILFTSKTR